MNINGLREEMVQLSHAFFARGWVFATSGNFSARVGQDLILITASGKEKEKLQPTDLILINLEGELQDKNAETPSAESKLHCRLYKSNPDIGSVLHTHSVHSTVLSSSAQLKAPLMISNYEMLKALQGVSTHHHTEVLPVFSNEQDMEQLSQNVLQFLHLNPQIHGFLIAGHGLYSWGTDLRQAKRHIEALEFLLEAEYCRLVWK